MVVTSNGVPGGRSRESETEEVEKRTGEMEEAEGFAWFLGEGRDFRDFGFNIEVYLWLGAYIYYLVHPPLAI